MPLSLFGASSSSTASSEKKRNDTRNHLKKRKKKLSLLSWEGPQRRDPIDESDSSKTLPLDESVSFQDPDFRSNGNIPGGGRCSNDDEKSITTTGAVVWGGNKKSILVVGRLDGSSSPLSRRRSCPVRFSTVTVRDYDMCLGDNPSVARGAPISLDWTYRTEQSCGLNEYENVHEELEKGVSTPCCTAIKDDGSSHRCSKNCNGSGRSRDRLDVTTRRGQQSYNATTTTTTTTTGDNVMGGNKRGTTIKSRAGSSPPMISSFKSNSRSDGTDQMKLTSLQRLHILKDLGYSRKDIKEATDQVQVARKQRFQTMRQLERNNHFQRCFERVPFFSRFSSLSVRSSFRDKSGRISDGDNTKKNTQDTNATTRMVAILTDSQSSYDSTSSAATTTTSTTVATTTTAQMRENDVEELLSHK